MTICPSHVHLEAVPNVEVFRLRCEVRAFLVAEGEMDLIEAVDGLQAAAIEYGLVDYLGQDAVQVTMADAFWGMR
jgi:hypothetical protein